MLPTTIVVILGSQHYKTILVGGGTLGIPFISITGPTSGLMQILHFNWLRY